MAEYIDKAALVSEVEKNKLMAREPAARRILEIIKGMTVFVGVGLNADVAPVRHGRWEWFDEDTGTPISGYEREWGWRCSNCKTELDDDLCDPDDPPEMEFCSSCGARMDG